jgi:ABC-2 type transport system ATP-binding protein
MIETHGLSRTFKTRGGDVEAVRSVDMHVAAGEIVGFLGPNGAGKTTTLRMLTTLLEPTAGTATVAGSDVAQDPVGVRRKVGYVAQGGMTYPEARAGEEIVDHARMYGISRAVARRRAQALFEQLDLPGLFDRPCKSLSGGQRRRLDIAMGLVHEPGLVFLDEPTSGLDPQSRANLWEHIRGLRDNLRTTVFLTTHYLEEADALCDRILIIDHGEIVARGTPEELKRHVSGDVVVLTLADASATGAAAAIAARVSGAEPTVDGTTVHLQVTDGAATLPSLLRELDVDDIRATAVEVRRPSLDDVFLELTGRSLRDEPASQTGVEYAHSA